MKFPLTVCVFLLTGGYENSTKYFYKGPSKSVLILQSDGGKYKDRFSLQDDHKRSFTVTIRNLKMEDAGLYGCRAGAEHYKEVNLIVITAPQRSKPVQSSTSSIHQYINTSTVSQAETERRTTTGNTTDEVHQSTTHLASVAGGLGLVLLVLTLCSGTILILKKRKRKCGTDLVQHNTETDHMYEEIPNSDIAMTDHMYEEIPNSDVTAVTYSSNQMPASHLSNCKRVSTVYVTVTNQQPDSNPAHTHSTSQVTDTANIMSPDPTQDSRTELTYQTATHPQNILNNEGQIYSLINDE
ncbi:CMRF35-like molecule 1 isoform X2 [Chanodichthys erythropterus]|uniref:CMRF35-like molecule 1 isoform X2 n=1 Tax=Chanodichthys erythropterus TaxID=933992 RepID=UPI00351E4DD3